LNALKRLLPYSCLLIVFTIIFGAQTSASANEGKPPYIVLIMTDDLGWMDLACQGNGKLRTPNIDAFAKQGVRFTDAYSASPVCSPTRAVLMTGIARQD
jgi:arylsulfatase A-like enzyme